MIGDDDIEDWDDFEEVDLSKKKYVSDEQLENYSIGQKKRFSKEEERIKNSVRKKEMWKDPEYRKKYLEGFKERNIKLGKKRRQSHKETLILFKKKHGNKYDYSKVNIVTQRTPIEIICKKCNKSFFMEPTSHKRRGCPVCALYGKKHSKETKDKISIANKKLWEDPEKRKHYEEVNRKKVRTPEYRKKYLEGMKNRKTTQLSRKEILRRYKEKHGDRFDYSKTVFGTENEKVSIVCKEHGEFTVIRRNHLRSKSGGCPKCKKPSK